MPPTENQNPVFVGSGAPSPRLRRLQLYISGHTAKIGGGALVICALLGGTVVLSHIASQHRAIPPVNLRHSTNSQAPAGPFTGGERGGSQSTAAPSSNPSPATNSSSPNKTAATPSTTPQTASSTPKPTVSLGAAPNAITAGQTATLTWTSSNAAACSASWTSSTASSGNQSVAPSATTTYTITCSGSGGSATASTTVSVTAPTSTCTTVLSGSQDAELQNDTYHLQSNEWGSSAPFSICTDNNLDFQITDSGINVPQNGAPGAFPSLYKGCHWGYCTVNSGLPVAVSAMTATANKVTTSYSTTTVSSGAWDDSYDIWFNASSSTNNNSTNGLEMMIWLSHYGSVQPAGNVVASNLSIGGNSYNVWYGGSGTNGGTVSYVLTSPATSVSNLDLGKLAADAASRGYMQSTWYLIDVEAGFEPWQGGVGLTANSFSVTVQ